jgi:hypothetical protein
LREGNPPLRQLAETINLKYFSLSQIPAAEAVAAEAAEAEAV